MDIPNCMGLEGLLTCSTRCLDVTLSWNAIILIFSEHGFGVQSLSTFVEMWSQGVRPNSMTYASVLSACKSIYDLEWGTHLHARIV